MYLGSTSSPIFGCIVINVIYALIRAIQVQHFGFISLLQYVTLRFIKYSVDLG
jgi:hypothetical protein